MSPTPCLLLFCFVLLARAELPAAEPSSVPSYDPLFLDAAHPLVSATYRDLEVHDAKRGRDIPIRVWTSPPLHAPRPVILFSHGLGGTREASSYLAKHWAARGYIAVFIQHPGSDDSVWRGKPVDERLTAMKQAANGTNFLRRVQDIPAVLDQLARWNRTRGNEWYGRLDLSRIGMSGHSFGAVTTQAVSGQRFMGQARFTDKRIRAAIAFSPSSPRRGDPNTAFGSVSIPWMLMTGTRDVARIGTVDVASRLRVFAALPPGNAYELFLYNAEHSAFADHRLPGDTSMRNPNHHRVIVALSTAFWDATLQENTAARAWLRSNAPKALLEDKDRWRWK